MLYQIPTLFTLAVVITLSGCLGSNSKPTPNRMWTPPSNSSSGRCEYWDNAKKKPPVSSNRSCETESPTSKNIKDLAVIKKELTELEKPRWHKVPEADEWTQITLQTMESESKQANAKPLWQITPRDIGEYCPKYKNMDEPARKNFWVFFYSCMTEAESTNCPTARKDKALGLFQFGLADMQSSMWAPAFRCSNVKTTQGAFTSSVNLKCGVQGVAALIRRDGIIGGRNMATNEQGAAQFFGVLRHRNTQSSLVMTNLRNYPPCSNR